MSRLIAKPTKWSARPAKTQISLGIRPVWSESSLSAWRKVGSLATQWAHSKDSDQTGRMPRLIWGFAGRTGHFVGFDMRRLKRPSTDFPIIFELPHPYGSMLNQLLSQYVSSSDLHGCRTLVISIDISCFSHFRLFDSLGWNVRCPWSIKVLCWTLIFTLRIFHTCELFARILHSVWRIRTNSS